MLQTVIMKNGIFDDAIHKEIVIIGNGPSGIALSYMLSGNIPYLTSDDHPDELLSMRLKSVKNPCLVRQDLGYLANGLEGRSTNPISLLIDALIHPCADIGIEHEPLIEWRNDGVQIDHIVLGKGPPGGTWHSMDPHILTLSLGAWMALPGFPYQGRDGVEKRASAINVARYYEQYVNELNLTGYFKNDVYVTNIIALNKDDSFDESAETNQHNWVKKVDDEATERIKLSDATETGEIEKSCLLSDALSFIRLRRSRKATDRCCKRPRECVMKHDLSPDRKIRELTDTSNDSNAFQQKSNESQSPFTKLDALNIKNLKHDKNRSISFSCDFNNFKSSCDSLNTSPLQGLTNFNNVLKNSFSLDFSGTTNNFVEVPNSVNVACDTNLFSLNHSCDFPSTSNNLQKNKTNPNWLIEAYHIQTGNTIRYTCNQLVLANGVSDSPNRLTISKHEEDPPWLLHNLKSLEIELDSYVEDNPAYSDPVLVVGAGLSAADAVIAVRGRNIPVLHVFRSKSADFSKQLPENMYPEYHKVHQMMQDGGSTYPLYKAFPEYALTDFCPSSRTVTLMSKNGEKLKFDVAYAIILIGSRPDLSFLPKRFNLGVKKEAPIDCKTNTIDVNRLNYMVKGVKNLYAMGPLVGDNFVRFIPGGALAIVADLYKKCGC